MYVLGLNGTFTTAGGEFPPGFQLGTFFHDSAACVLRDGRVLAAIEEERLVRAKHTNVFPTQAVRACLDLAGVPFHRIDRISYFWQEQHLDDGLRVLCMRNPEMPVRGGRELVAQRLGEAVGAEVRAADIDFWRHHDAQRGVRLLPVGPRPVAGRGHGRQRRGRLDFGLRGRTGRSHAAAELPRVEVVRLLLPARDRGSRVPVVRRVQGHGPGALR
jgi:hypothetical protein